MTQDAVVGKCCLGSVCFDANEDAKPPSLTFQAASKRRCTDVGCLILYLISWGGFLALIIAAANRGGNPQKVIHNVNWRGELCGFHENVKDRPYSAWVVMPNGANPFEADCTDCYQIKTCIKDCGGTIDDDTVFDKYQSQPLLYSCIPVPPYAVHTHAANTTFRGQFPYGRYFNSISEFASRTYSDLFIGWPVMLTSSVLAIVFSYFYAWLTTKWARVLLVFGVLTVTAGGVLISYTMLKNGRDMALTVSTQRALVVELIGWACVVLTVLFVCMVIALRHRIAIAIEVVREAMTAVRHMKFLVLFPIAPFFVGLGYFVLFVLATLLVGSVWIVDYKAPLPDYLVQRAIAVGNTELSSVTTRYHTYEYNEHLKKSFAYILLHLLWTIQILIYFVYVVISVAVSRWYFLPRIRIVSKIPGQPDKFKKRLPHWPLWDAIYIVLRYHMGTVILGALLIAFLQLIRTMIKYFAKIQCITQSRQPNCLQVCVGNMIHYCSFCSTCCLDYINKNALIWTALYGDDYMIAAKSTFTLLFSNVIRLAAVTVVGSYLMLIGKVLVSAITAGVGGIIILHFYGEILNSTVLPVITIFLMAFMVSSLFMTTMETMIDTVFIAFLVDEMINGPKGSMYASQKLQDLLKKHAKRTTTALERAQLELAQQPSTVQQPPTKQSSAADAHEKSIPEEA